MTSVYEETNFQGRVNLAASYIAQRRRTTRTFDTCFEMHDGDVVAVALFRRAEANPKGALAKNLFKYICEDLTRRNVDTYSHVKTRNLKHEAAALRTKAKKEFEVFMAAQTK